jgi:hypothetical protein
MKYIMIINKDSNGLVAEISELLGQHKINIDSIDAHSESGFAQIRLFTSNNDQSLSILNEAGFKAVPDENILVKIDDKPGALGRISRKLSKSNIDIRSIAMIEQNEGHNIVAIVTSNDTKAKEVLDYALVK